MKPQFLITIILLFTLTNVKAANDIKTIYIQPFGNFSDSSLQVVVTKLKKIFKQVEVKKPIELPTFTYYKPRNRYRADKLISYLSKTNSENSYVIGFTNKDISTTKNNIKDWGVMGLGYCPGNACIVSTHRIKGDLNKLLKLSLHELGHNTGLPHCSDKHCYMADAEGKDNLNKEAHFCNKCKNFLIKSNWKFNS